MYIYILFTSQAALMRERLSTEAACVRLRPVQSMMVMVRTSSRVSTCKGWFN